MLLKTDEFSFLLAYLKPFSNCLQKVWDDGVVPQVSKPNSWTIYIYWTREEEPWTWKGKFRYYSQIIVTWIKIGSNNNFQFFRERRQVLENKRSNQVKRSSFRVQKSPETTRKSKAFKKNQLAAFHNTFCIKDLGGLVPFVWEYATVQKQGF